MKSRVFQHCNDKDWWDYEAHHIEYAECQDKFEMDTYEKYYITTLNPKYNIKDTQYMKPRFELPELEFKHYDKLKKINPHTINLEFKMRATERDLIVSWINAQSNLSFSIKSLINIHAHSKGVYDMYEYLNKFV